MIVTLDASPLVDVDALDEIIRSDRNYHERGGRVVLCSISASVRTLLQTTGVINTLTVYPDLEGALQELSPP